MFCGMVTVQAKPGRMDELVQAGLDHARALRQQPGCVAALVLEERGTRAQVNLAVFETEGDFSRAVEATATILRAHRLDELVEGPSSFRAFDVRSPHAGPSRDSTR